MIQHVMTICLKTVPYNLTMLDNFIQMGFSMYPQIKDDDKFNRDSPDQRTLVELIDFSKDFFDLYDVFGLLRRYDYDFTKKMESSTGVKTESGQDTLVKYLLQRD